jgi:ubiquinone/menaquinone biosynthesis C-methylase UbiE
MTLAAEYERQFRWRDWRTILGALPELQGQTVLDLGCGIGDLAAELVARGARVTGVDADADLLGFARERKIPNAEFRSAGLRALPNLGVRADGIWCSFTAAYFPRLAAWLTEWAPPAAGWMDCANGG